MSKEQKTAIVSLIKFLFIVPTLYLAYVLKNWIILFGGVLTSVFIGELIGFTLPVSKRKRKKPTSTKNKQNPQNKNTRTKVSHTRLLPDAQLLKMDLNQMSARELERLCYLYYRSKGYKAFETTSGSDGGIDLVYRHPTNGKTAVQVKHYMRSGNQIPVMQIRELDFSKRNYHCVYSEFITTTRFSLPARREKPISMTFKDITWFEKEIIPWMKRVKVKQK